MLRYFGCSKKGSRRALRQAKLRAAALEEQVSLSQQRLSRGGTRALKCKIDEEHARLCEARG